MDVYDNPTSPNYIATFELPGVRTADMSLSIKEGNLIIDGERRCPMIHCGAASEPPKPAVDDGRGSASMQIDVRPVKAAVQELRYGRFHRAVPLPSGVQVSLFPPPMLCMSIQMGHLARDDIFHFPIVLLYSSNNGLEADCSLFLAI